MKEQYTGHAIRIYPAENTSLPLGNPQNAVQHEKIDAEECNTPRQSECFSQRSKDEIGMLFRYIFTSCLGSFQESFAEIASGANGYLALAYIIVIGLTRFSPSLRCDFLFWLQS